jgi:GNAT superfamily N-acetyltransferase
VAILTLLTAGDEAELERFLVAHADSSMFLRANSRNAGLVDRGEPLQGTYVAARESGDIVAVAASCWNGMVIVQGRADAVGEVAREAVVRSSRAVKGFSGPFAQVVAARAALGLARRPATLDTREDLFALELDGLRVPPPLVDGRWICRRPIAEDSATLVRWGRAYEVESLGAAPDSDDDDEPEHDFVPPESQRVLVADGTLAATSRFNAELPDCVQIGGVYTPPALRGRGYARAVVAGSLVDARARGVTRSLLFTAHDNIAARTAYLALGYQIVGDYGLVLFDV